MCATCWRSGFGAAVSCCGMTTRGDQILDRALAKVGGKGLFVKELETALERARRSRRAFAEGRADGPAAGFELAAVLEREDPRDAFVSNRYAALDALPQGARASAPRACAAWCSCCALRPDLRVEPLRGNLDTRLRKLDEGGYDAIVLAAAGLMRLGLAARIRSLLRRRARCCPAPGRARSASRCAPTRRRCASAGRR